MKNKLIAVLAAIAACGVISAAAQAAPIRECGRINYWIYNITTRNVSCHDARHFVGKLAARTYSGQDRMPTHNGWVRLPGWRTYWATVRERQAGSYEYEFDVRSTRTNHVIRFQWLAGD